jgi:mannose-1-phosphate guanylyltransferase
VTRFREKPNAKVAETFLQQGNFRWNAGMFIWTIPAILAAFDRHVPELGHFIGRMPTWHDFAFFLRTEFAKLPRISIDYAIMEKAERVLVVESAFDWDDVGSWTAAAKYLPADAEGNHANCDVKILEARDNIIFSAPPKTVALLGVRDLIIVQTADALLVCHRTESEKIKQLVGLAPLELQ